MAFSRKKHSVRRRTFAKNVMTVNQAAYTAEILAIGGQVTHFELLVRSTSPLWASQPVSLARSHASPYSHSVHRLINENEAEGLRAGFEILVQDGFRGRRVRQLSGGGSPHSPFTGYNPGLAGVRVAALI